jgi:hypothetical protein
MKRTIYRDRKTGRFVSRSTWKRSRARKGIRYVRERARRPVVRRKRVPPVKARPAALPEKGIEVRSGYAGRKENSYTLIVRIGRKPDETLEEIRDFIEALAGEGKFDGEAQEIAEGPADLQWATFHNRIKKVRDLKKAPAKPRLIGFERSAP